MIITNLLNDISFPDYKRPRTVAKKDIRDITILDSNRIEISLLGKMTESARNVIMIFYDQITSPATASISELRDLLIAWKDNKNTVQVINYDTAGGNTILGSTIKLPGNMVTLQVLYNALDKADSVVSLYQSSDGINWDPIVDSTGTIVSVTLLSTQSSTVNCFGVACKYIGAFWDAGTVTSGTIESLNWRFE